MGNSSHVVYKASDRSYLAIIKKEIHALGVHTGLDQGRLGELDIVVSELLSNLAKHAKEGQVLVRQTKDDGFNGVEIIGIDQGPGMTDVKRMISDGVSTSQTLGMGLGAMKRLSDIFQVYSIKDWGTITLIRIYDKELPFLRTLPVAEFRSIILPKSGEKECGDGFFKSQNSEHIKLFLGDGLGHGSEAAKAVKEAGAAFMQCPENDPPEIIRWINTAVRKTRGLVGTIAVFDINSRKWKICGVGNIMTRINGPGLSKNYMSYNGIIGLNVPRTLNAQEIDYEKGQQLIMCSDGLKSKWDVFRYPSIMRYDLSILSAALLKDYARTTDDMSVVACKINL